MAVWVQVLVALLKYTLLCRLSNVPYLVFSRRSAVIADGVRQTFTL